MVQHAVGVATELQRQKAQLQQEQQQMNDWLATEKRVATQHVNAAFEEKDKQCEKLIRDACAQAER